MKNTTGIEQEYPAGNIAIFFDNEKYKKGEPIFSIRDKNTGFGFNLTGDQITDKSTGFMRAWEELFEKPCNGQAQAELITNNPYQTGVDFSINCLEEFWEWFFKKSEDYVKKTNHLDVDNFSFYEIKNLPFIILYKNTIIEYIYPKIYTGGYLGLVVSDFKGSLDFQCPEHMTFNFPLSDLGKFYKFMCVCNPEIIELTQHAFEKNFPFSGQSFLLAAQLKLHEETYNLAEFFKYYLSMSLREDVNPNNGAVNEYKKYFLLLCRSSFKSMFASIEKLEQEKLLQYLEIMTADIKEEKIFPHKWTQGTIGNPPYSYMENEVLATTTEAELTVENVLNSLTYLPQQLKFTVLEQAYMKPIFKYDPIFTSANDLQESFYESIDNTINIESLSKSDKQQIYDTINNLYTSDWFSPVPMSPPDDPMGFYSRTKGFYTPLIEVRFTERVVETLQRNSPGKTMENYVRDLIKYNAENWNSPTCKKIIKDYP